jgi:hypothetical protein
MIIQPTADAQEIKFRVRIHEPGNYLLLYCTNPQQIHWVEPESAVYNTAGELEMSIAFEGITTNSNGAQIQFQCYEIGDIDLSGLAESPLTISQYTPLISVTLANAKELHRGIIFVQKQTVEPFQQI